MKSICIAAMALLCYSCQRKITPVAAPAQQQAISALPTAGMLLGTHTKEDLQQAPYAAWFNKNYGDYIIDSPAIARLKPLLQNKQFEIFLGTWCGDSKREVPRMLKLLEYAGVQASQVKLIMVDNHDGTYKQSPTHEEKGKSIHRVPTLIMYDDKKELNRIVEYPVVSLEQDLLAIATAAQYQPNYKGAAYLLQLAAANSPAIILKDSINTIQKLQALLQRSTELNALGYVWMASGETAKALMAFQLNAQLFPTDANVYDSLGEIYTKLDKKAEARLYYQKVLQLQPGNTNAVKMLAQLN
ncbi:MAG: tetratricopeptide repeat protein [Chitinophagaceae bacterium]